MQILVDTLRHNPEIALFLTLAIGFWLGAIKFGSFSLGTITCTLVAGLLIGQLHIGVAPLVQNVFFAMFLFAVGYSVGPQFVPAMKKDGLPQVLFAVIVCVTGLLTTYAFAKLLGYNAGLAAGLLAGGMTNSGILGVAVANMKQLGLDPKQTETLADLVTIGYAVCYPVGTIAGTWFFGTFAPKLLRIDLAKACREYVGANPTHGSNSDVEMANRPVLARSFKVASAALAGHTPRELNAQFGSKLGGAYITRVRDGSNVLEAETTTFIREGDTIAIAGSPDALLKAEKLVGPEVDDRDLVAYAAETIDIVVTSKAAIGRTIRDLEREEIAQYGRPVFILGIERAGHPLSMSPELTLQRHDVLTVRGVHSHVESLIQTLGCAERPTSASDIAFMGLGIVIGSLIGTLTLHVAGIPLSLSTGVGTLLAGIGFGYIRSVYRTFGRIPAAALWVFNNVGLNGFIAAVGLNAAPGLVVGLEQYGIGLFVGALVVTLVPSIVAVLLGKYVFRFHTAILFGVCAGAHSTTAALGSVQEAAQSTVPAIGYTVPYAVSRIVLAVFGVIILLIMK